MDFKAKSKDLLSLQKQCTKIIYESMDLKHLVH